MIAGSRLNIAGQSSTKSARAKSDSVGIEHRVRRMSQTISVLLWREILNKGVLSGAGMT